MIRSASGGGDQANFGLSGGQCGLSIEPALDHRPRVKPVAHLTATEYVPEQLAVKRGRHGQSIESKATIIFAAATKRVTRRTRDTLAGGNRGQRTVDRHHRAADI